MSDDLIPYQRVYKRDKLVHLLTTHEYSDCVFVCGRERIPAHRLILAYSSPVFESMFYGQMAETEINLPDIDPEDLKKMLQYVYTDHTDIPSVTSAWALIYICQKYFLSDLLSICVAYVKKNLSVSNLLISYEYAMLYNQQELIKVCTDDIVKYTKGLLLNNDYHMKSATLNFILEQNVVNATESDHIMIAVKWAMEECAIKDVEATQENIWNILLDAKILEKLNFAKFDESLYELTPCILNCDVYYHVSCLSLFVHGLSCFYGKEYEKSSCKTVPAQLNYRHRDSYRISKNNIFYQTIEISNVISSSRSVYVFGLAVTTLRRPEKVQNTSYVGCIEIKVTCNKYNYYRYKVANRNMEYDGVFFINFPLPMRLERGNVYRLCVSYAVEPTQDRGEVLLHYLGQKLVEKTNGTVINFTDELEGSVVRAMCFYPA